METLYDLLGALPRDDAEGLRTAFRRAAKGAHPDLNPGDPDAGLKFRQLVRANEILADVEQRGVYDHLLELAHLEQEQASKRAVAGTIHKLASGVIVLVVISILVVGSYLVFLLSAASVAAPGQIMLAAEEKIVEPPAPQLQASVERTDAAADLGESVARSYHARGVSAYQNGDLPGAVAAFDSAIQYDPKFTDAYVDRGIVFYRMRKFDRAYADIATASRLERMSRATIAPAIAKRQRIRRTAMESGADSVRPRSTAEAYPSR